MLLIAVALSRLPFLGTGYGVNVDAWRVARVAGQLSETGLYEVSRFPGYPVQEIVCSWLWRGGPWALNGASAVCSVVAVWAFVACARRLGCRDALLAGLALAMTPVFFINSVSAKDYVWALAFVLGSLFCILDRRPLVAGLLLGLAVGCRLTSAAMLVPLGLILSGEMERPQRDRALLGFGLTSLAASLAVFAPVWLRYGSRFLTFYENHARPDWETIALRAGSEIWGNIGLFGLGAVLVGCAIRCWRAPALPSSLPNGQNALFRPALGLIIIIYGAAYLRLPDQAGYLIPIIPATLLLAAGFAPRLCFQLCCLCLAIAPWLELGRNGPHAGAILADHRERTNNLRNVASCLNFAESLPGENLIVVGGWEPQIAVLTLDRPPLKNRYVYLLERDEMIAAIQGGHRIFYLPSIRFFNVRVNGTDPARYGQDLFAIYQAKVMAGRTR